ncbi:MAG TPA: FlgD immunoglobulin-like domain containing protein, partial [Candidatus Limnocylindrales bacterium]|nr:FlgD immunoglobulin-like domain containing protein [Candidatus Limnocylindrales bacterium]
SASAIAGTDTASWWAAASAVNMGTKLPGTSGALDSTVVLGLTGGTRYYAILRTADEVPNWSGFSNYAVLDPVEALGVVSGTVREYSTGVPLGSALVQESLSGRVTYAGVDGSFSLTVTAGTTTNLTAVKYGYAPLSTSVQVPLGGTRLIDFALPKVPTGILDGSVVRTTDGSSVSGAELTLMGTPLVGLTGSNGRYSLTVPQGTVNERCERPGFQPLVRNVSINAGVTQSMNFNLTPVNWYDDAQSDAGWSLRTTGDNATSGIWVRTVPTRTSVGTTAVQPSKDHSPDGGTLCFVTGNSVSTDINAADVDAGKTTLTSPILHLGGIADPRIVFWRWYTNSAGTSPGEDPFVIQISNNGGAWITVESLSATRNYWQRVEIRATNYFGSPGNVQVRFVAQDNGNASTVEAGIDDLEYYGGGIVTAASGESAPVPAVFLGAPRPSPSKGPTQINLELPRAMQVDANVFNVQGRLVRTIESGMMTAGVHVLRWDGRLNLGDTASSGVYWLKVAAGDVQKKVRIVVVK